MPTDDNTIYNYNGYNIHPSAFGATELSVTTPEVVVTAPRSIYDPTRTYSSSYDPNGFFDFMRVATGPVLNNLSPSQWIGRARDAYNGKFDATNWLYGNSGVMSEEEAAKYPKSAAALNLMTDLGIFGGAKAFMDNPFRATAQGLGAAAVGGIGDLASNAALKATTGKTWGENVSQYTGMAPTLAEFTNPATLAGGAAGYKYGDNVGRRMVETALRTTGDPNPIPAIIRGNKKLFKGNEGGYRRLGSLATYTLTGRRLGKKGYYNSLAPYKRDNRNNTLPEINYYDGSLEYEQPNIYGNDIIDAFLYGKEIDPRYGVTLVSKGNKEDFGIHKDYIAEKYSDKAKDIPVYEAVPFRRSSPIIDPKDVKITRIDGAHGFLNSATYKPIDLGGHQVLSGKYTGLNYPSIDDVTMQQDIWKFNPDDYMNKWTKSMQGTGSTKKALLKAGLTAVDSYGTPVITRTSWTPTL